MNRKGLLYIVSAPSGAGKTTICNRVMAATPHLRQSISFTTRPRREGEQDGIDYHFVDQPAFDRMVEEGAFLEWATVHGNCYGTAQTTVEEALAEGNDILLDIDVQGAAQLQAKGLDAVFIFILPPSMTELENRLVGRNTDSPEVVARRIDNAVGEITRSKEFDYVVVNDVLDQAVETVLAIMTAEPARSGRMLNQLPGDFNLSQ